VYFNNDDPIYMAARKPDIDTIVTTCVHESSHFWSSLKGTNGLGIKYAQKNLDWDECVTEYLARRTYFGVQSFRKDRLYKSGYGTFSEFITQALGLMPPMPEWKKDIVREFPKPFNTLIDNMADDTVRQPLERALARRFVTWYLLGGKDRDGNQTIDQFFDTKIPPRDRSSAGWSVGDVIASGANNEKLGRGRPSA
jgi:hypothetical protein